MGASRGHSPNFLDVVRRLFRGGPPNKCQGAKMYPRTKRGDTVNYQLVRTRLLGHTSVLILAVEVFMVVHFGNCTACCHLLLSNLSKQYAIYTILLLTKCLPPHLLHLRLRRPRCHLQEGHLLPLLCRAARVFL